MNNDGLQKLKDIGAQKIYEDTHIPVGHIQAILHASFDGLNKIQFIGFISILQREYNIDLSELKNAGTAYYNEKNPVETTTEDGIFIAPKKKKNFTLLYILLTMVALLAALYYTVEYTDEEIKTPSPKQSNIQILSVDTNVSQKKDENKTLKDANTTQETAIKKEKAVEKSFKIIARSKVWMGYIDVATNKKYQKTFTGEFDLDPDKEWLLIFGHGYIDVVTDTEKKEFNSKKTLRLLYKEGAVKELTFEEFKRLNRGSAW
ncbi:hypothetical protein [Sulfurimonas hydrogeniphila]|uniref:hypothetical protein n=1 Tax=Sulfurimonas hydrogeniphila TaxID=2509341 RepID=UPI00125ECA2E|nr:hypothetical protein [Sulfurimonas hydrogeniphila]